MRTFLRMAKPDNQSGPGDLLKIGQVAEAFNVTVGTVRNWDREGLLRSIRTPGGQRRFRRSDVDAALEANAS